MGGKLRLLFGLELAAFALSGCVNSLMDFVKQYVEAAGGPFIDPAQLDTPTDWNQEDMGFVSTEVYDLLAVGKGRTGDSKSRVYAAAKESIMNRDIYEFTYSSGTWQDAEITAGLSDLTGSATGFIVGNIGNGREVFISGFGGLFEYRHQSVWNGADRTGTLTAINDLSIGLGKNDGINMLYAADMLGGLIEVEYASGEWANNEVDGAQAYCSTVAKARQDSKYRLYACIDSPPQVYEFVWKSSSWELLGQCGTSPASGATRMRSGFGRNDGVERLYLLDQWQGIYELSFNSSGSTWTYTTISGTTSAYDIALGKGRDDGAIRLYAATDDGVAEYSWIGTSWKRTSLAATSPVHKIMGIAVGDGRNDGTVRIYAAGDDKRLYELTAN